MGQLLYPVLPITTLALVVKRNWCTLPVACIISTSPTTKDIKLKTKWTFDFERKIRLGHLSTKTPFCLIFSVSWPPIRTRVSRNKIQRKCKEARRQRFPLTLAGPFIWFLELLPKHNIFSMALHLRYAFDLSAFALPKIIISVIKKLTSSSCNSGTQKELQY